MRITNFKNETAQTLLDKAKRGIMRNLNELKNNKSDLYVEFRELNPDLSEAIKGYCSIYKKLQTVEDDGLLEEFSIASKKLISAFNFTENAENYEFVSNNFVSIKESPLNKAMEAIYDVSLFREAGKARYFTNIYNLQRTITKVYEDRYIFFVTPYFYYVNATTGSILRKTDTKILDFDASKLYSNGYDGIYYGDMPLHTFEGLQGVWEKATYAKKSGNATSGVTYDYVCFSTVESIEEHGGKKFYMPAHQVVGLCWYGISVMKFCSGSGSLLTIDHIDENPQNNSIMNLAVVTRVDNIKKAKTGAKGLNFIMFFEVLGVASSPFSYKW